MAHNINTYIGKEAAWHKLGLVTGKFQTTEDLMAHPGFQFDVIKEQLRDEFGRPVEAWGTFRWDREDRAKDDKSSIKFLGAVGRVYQVIPHAAGLSIVDELVASADGAHYSTAGVLGNGETVWGLADLGLSLRVGDDVQQGYLLFYTGHDGSKSAQFKLTFTRVVCQNTLNIAIAEKARAALTVRHNRLAESRLASMADTLRTIKTQTQTVEEKMRFLAGRKLNREGYISIMNRLFPEGEQGAITTRRDNILASVLHIFEDNDGNAFPEQRGTVYNLLNAVTNYVDHERSAKAGARSESAMFGTGDMLKTKALGVMLEEAQSLPEKIYTPTVSDLQALWAKE